ncbi:MAG: DUF1580 domain-containing protein [Planctomycetales bacterium]|jgi:hypothetical protein
MPIDARTEELLTLTQAARRYRPPDARPLAPSTIWRWHKKGISGVRLETVCMGGTRYTSAEALQRYFAQVTAAKEAGLSIEESLEQPGTRTPQSRQRLEDAGLL